MAGLLLLTGTLSACWPGQGGGGVDVSPSSPTVDPTGSVVDDTTAVQKIAFFGSWRTNSFTQAVYRGVQAGARGIGAEVVDFSPIQFDPAAQIEAVREQTITGDSQVFVVLAADTMGMAGAAAEAIEAGITVVAVYNLLGSDFDTLEPQVPGLLVVGDTPVANGEVLAELAADACGDLAPCTVAYLEGYRALPYDNARTQSFEEALRTLNPGIVLAPVVEGGYTATTGIRAAQEVLQSNPEVNVMVGSSQAMLGVMTVVDTATVRIIGNGASCEAYEAVIDGEWYALYDIDPVGMGLTAVELAIESADGLDPSPVIDIHDLRDPRGTASRLAALECAYSDLR